MTQKRSEKVINHHAIYNEPALDFYGKSFPGSTNIGNP
jgi:hypothetical protein